MPDTTVSIVIPTLNEAGRIADCLHHAWATGPLEVLVADGGSEDATVKLAAPLATRVVCCTASRGLQLNAGARAACGDYLLFLHADNRLPADALRQLEDAGRRTELVCGAFCQRISAAGIGYRLLEWGNSWRARWLGLPYGDQAIFVRRDRFWDLGGFAEIPLMEDIDLMWRLRRRARPILLEGPVEVSPRRWRSRGLVCQTLTNWMLVSAWLCGASPAWLRRFYGTAGSLPGDGGQNRVPSRRVRG